MVAVPVVGCPHAAVAIARRFLALARPDSSATPTLPADARYAGGRLVVPWIFYAPAGACRGAFGCSVAIATKCRGDTLNRYAG